MKISVHCLSGETVCFDMAPSDTLLKLREKTQARLGYAIMHLRLLSPNGNHTKDSTSVGEYEVKGKEIKFHLLNSMRGGHVRKRLPNDRMDTDSGDTLKHLQNVVLETYKWEHLPVKGEDGRNCGCYVIRETAISSIHGGEVMYQDIYDKFGEPSGSCGFLTEWAIHQVWLRQEAKEAAYVRAEILSAINIHGGLVELIVWVVNNVGIKFNLKKRECVGFESEENRRC